MFYEIKNETITLFIKVNPKANKNQFKEVLNEVLNNRIKVDIKAPPVDGAANKELIKFLNKTFKVPKSQISIKGEKSKEKDITMPFNDKIKEFISSF